MTLTRLQPFSRIHNKLAWQDHYSGALDAYFLIAQGGICLAADVRINRLFMLMLFGVQMLAFPKNLNDIAIGFAGASIVLFAGACLQYFAKSFLNDKDDRAELQLLAGCDLAILWWKQCSAEKAPLGPLPNCLHPEKRSDFEPLSGTCLGKS